MCTAFAPPAAAGAPPLWAVWSTFYGCLSISAALTVFGTTSEPHLRRGLGFQVFLTHRPHIYKDPMCGNSRNVGKSVTAGTLPAMHQVFALAHLYKDTCSQKASPPRSYRSHGQIPLSSQISLGRGASRRCRAQGPKALSLARQTYWWGGHTFPEPCAKSGPWALRGPGKQRVKPRQPTRGWQ